MNQVSIVSRRTFVLGTGGLAAFLALPQMAAANEWQAAMMELVGTSEPAEGKVDLVMPEIAENGNVVPFDVTVDSPMTDGDHVKAVHVLATGNPTPGVASYMMSPAMGEATISSRMRLGKTQDVIAVAEMSDGSVYGVTTTVKVTIGGCGG